MTDAAPHAQSLTVAATRREVIARWKRRAIRVSIARKALPLAILVILVAMGIWLGVETLKPHLGTLSINAADIRMANPRFYGRDNKDRAFQLDADQAIRSDSDPDLVHLIKPVFSLEGSHVRANTGDYRDGSDRIVLNGDVVYTDAQGKQVNTQQAYINTKTGILTNGAQSQGIEIAAPMGHVQGQTYTANRSGDVTLRGNVHATLHLQKKTK